MTLANHDQHEAWNGDSGRRWAADADRRDAVLAPVGDLLLHAAALRPGEAVLDLGCGCGVTTIAAADLVSPGLVVGLDLSEPMLDLAYDEDSRAEVDMNIVCTDDGRFIELQGTAEREPFSRAQMDEMVALGVRGIEALIAMQKAVIAEMD